MVSRQDESLEQDMDKIWMQEYIRLDGCRRAYLNTIFNNQVDQFCGPNDMPCDFCHGRQLVLQYTSAIAIQQSQKWAQQEACLQRFIGFFQDHCIACIFALDLCITIQDWKSDGRIDHQAGRHCPNFQYYYRYIEKFRGHIQKKQKPADNSCHFECWLPSRFCKQWFWDGTSPDLADQNKAKCPRYNPIIIWAGLLEQWQIWEVIPLEYRPKRGLGSSSSTTMWPWNRQEYMQWFYQVDYEFFNTEVLQGVLAFYLWAERLEKDGVFSRHGFGG